MTEGVKRAVVGRREIRRSARVLRWERDVGCMVGGRDACVSFRDLMCAVVEVKVRQGV